MKKKNFLEGIIVFGVVTGILLPVRLVFVAYVSDNWFGSFGLISLISISLIVLTKKQKLGRFGQMFERQLVKLQQGKRGKFVYGQSIFFLIILGGTIFAIEQGNSVYSELKDELIKENQDLSDTQKILEKAEQIEFHEWVYGFVGLFLAVFYAFPQLSAVFALLNEISNGWVLHFYTVAFVEFLELFGILLTYRIILKKDKRTKTTDKNPRLE